MFLGIDLGTSGVKVVLVDASQQIVDQETAPLEVQRPRPLWSEQDPEDWWRAADLALGSLGGRQSAALRGVEAIGLSGQMHGAVLLDAGDRCLRPAILWNDGRSAEACEELERRAPKLRAITGNLAMPGFTAPKLVWVAEHEPDVFAATKRVLLPKDWLRLRLTGEYATDVSDASGTLWLDVERRTWSDDLLAATGLDATAMPRVMEGTDPTGVLRPEHAARWGLPDGVVVAGGAGDQAAGAAGTGVIRPGDAFLSLGTSGVLFVAGDRFAPNPERAVHAFGHCVPGRWHQMAVMLSAASCVSWLARLTRSDEAAFLAELESAPDVPEGLLFLPYLTGERTPHNDPHAKGVFFGMDADTDHRALGRAVLEGVAFAMADGQAALEEAGARIERISVIGGGSRSAVWSQILASALDRTLDYGGGGDVGPAFGAARLARLAANGEAPEDVCLRPVPERQVEPDPAMRERYRAKLGRFRGLYAALRESF